MSSQPPIGVRRLTERSISAQDRVRILQILLAAYKGNLQYAALTAGKSSLEGPLFQMLLDTTLSHGQLFVAGRGTTIDAVCLAFGPGQDIFQGFLVGHQYATDYIAKLPTEMQQWWTMHFRPKYAELSQLGVGGAEGRKDAWYIRCLAVDPAQQRRGLGRCLLENITRMADESNRRTCLETEDDRIVHYFASSRFRVQATKNFGSYLGGFPLFFMVREPATK